MQVKFYPRVILVIALAPVLFSGVEPFVQFWKKVLWGTLLGNIFKFGPVVQQELSFKQKFLDGQILDLRQNTRAHIEPWLRLAKIADWDVKNQNNLLNQSIELYISN